MAGAVAALASDTTDGTLFHGNAFSIRAPFLIEAAHTSVGVHMNIFYIIGVVVVILFVLGFLGLR